MDLDGYRDQAERFVTELERAHYLHFSGQTPELEIEPVYARHADLFTLEAVEALRGVASRTLIEFACYGFVARSTRRQQAELARAEAGLEVDFDSERLAFRQLPSRLANERDARRRAELDKRRLELTDGELNPLLLKAFVQAQQSATELGFESVLAMSQALSGIDLTALNEETEAFLQTTAASLERALSPQLRAHLGHGFEQLRRSDLPAFFRAPKLDRYFRQDRLMGALYSTLNGLGIDLDAQANVSVDALARPTKTSRAFCAPVQVPQEIYLVIAPVGGRDDYETLFHEAGHVEHYAHVDPGLSFEARHLGDNSVTEGFAFLFQYLAGDENWLKRRLGIARPEPIAAHSRAVKLVFLRRYAAKLGYELELQAHRGDYRELRELYVRRLSDALCVKWPGETWLSDVDPFFYCARYLRAWALEARLREHLRRSFGELWFEDPRAGAWLRELWRFGQTQTADELARELGAYRLDFEALAAGWQEHR